ncbi:MAG: thioredoxin-disulfide reductase [Candidatus Dojkabacteria bacterium]|nr:thioredoxin-disulfide reductase [Candidatus Dojkabacteria bacterium]
MDKNNNNKQDIQDIIIAGSGPAGLTAAIYAARGNLKPILLAGEIWGGQLMNTTEVENFPGFPEGIMGPDLMQNMIDQAKRFGTEFKYENVTEVDLKGEIKVIKTAKAEYKAKTVILATGSEPRRLKIPGEDKFYGRGVSTCATCDGAFYREKLVAIVGGGDSAMEEATFLSRFAKKVYLIHRKNEFRASKIMADRVLANDKIEVIWNTEVKEVLGEETVKGIKIYNNKDDSESELEINGFFLAIGHIPVTGYLNKQLPLNDEGYVQPLSFGTPKTNIDGVFVAGEIQDVTYKQAITTAGDGCKAAIEAIRFLDEIE